MDLICYIYVGHVINPDVPTYGLPGDHIADKPGHTNRPHTTRTYRACHTYRTRLIYRATHTELKRERRPHSPSHQDLGQCLSCSWSLVCFQPNLKFVFILTIFYLNTLANLIFVFILTIFYLNQPKICLHFHQFLLKVCGAAMNTEDQCPLTSTCVHHTAPDVIPRVQRCTWCS